MGDLTEFVETLVNEQLATAAGSEPPPSSPPDSSPDSSPEESDEAAGEAEADQAEDEGEEEESEEEPEAARPANEITVGKLDPAKLGRKQVRTRIAEIWETGILPAGNKAHKTIQRITWHTGGASARGFNGTIASVTINGKEAPIFALTVGSSRGRTPLELRGVDSSGAIRTIIAVAEDVDGLAEILQVAEDAAARIELYMQRRRTDDEVGPGELATLIDDFVG